MNTIIFKEDLLPKVGDLEKLYNDVGWSAYTSDMNNLVSAVSNSLKVITAWDDQQLVGLIRVVGDGHSILYIQDILVLGSYQKKGIGTKLITMILESYANVRQKVLLTDNEPGTIAFYKSVGFSTSEELGSLAFVKFDYK